MTTPSWYPDPMHRHELRWWDGASWTAHVNDHGVAAEDPLFGSDPGHPAWGPPTAMTPRTPTAVTTATPPSTTHARRSALVVGSIVAAAAIGVGAFLVARDKGGTTSLGDASTLPATTPTASTTTTTLATSTTPAEQVITSPETNAPTTEAPTTQPLATTTAPTTTPPTVATYTASELVAALSQRSGVPANWQKQENGVKNPTAHSSGAACNGPNDPARALDNDSVGEAYGPSYSLPNGGWFGVDAYSFASSKDADAFMAATATQANKCVTTRVSHRVSEKDLDVMTSPSFDNATWTLTDGAMARTAAADGSDRATFVSRSIGHIMKHNADTFSYRGIELLRYERHGATVLVFWRWGNNHYQGFSNYDPSWDFSPTEAELLKNARLLRKGILASLG